MSACHVITYVQSDADYWVGGVNQRIFILQGGIYKFFFTGGEPKVHQMAGGKSHLTLNINSGCPNNKLVNGSYH